MRPVPTDHACRTAAERAAHCLAPVRSLLLPADDREPSPAEVMPVVLRNYLGAGARPPAARTPGAGRPEPVSIATGATALLMCLDGLRAELTGTMAAWHAELGRRLHAMLADPRPSGRQTDSWQVLGDLKLRAQEVLTAVVDHGRPETAGPRLLVARFALLEDALSGVLRRISVPAEPAVTCASALTAAAGLLFGLALTHDEGPEARHR
ncbi:hypothetical protein GCM10010129_41040 [Streptomyces fumigatiscleroticus]|nr:hypothetical protein GCM10010129_41040 [Streptomyces fumigatiscleroticus]